MSFPIVRIERPTAARILLEEYGIKIPAKDKLGTDGHSFKLKTGATLRVGLSKWRDMQYTILSNRMDGADIKKYAIM
jgi:hypothetical protein